MTKKELDKQEKDKEYEKFKEEKIQQILAYGHYTREDIQYHLNTCGAFADVIMLLILAIEKLRSERVNKTRVEKCTAE